MIYYYIYNNYNSSLHQKFYYNFGRNNCNSINNTQLMNTILQCFAIIQNLDSFINNQNVPHKISSYDNLILPFFAKSQISNYPEINEDFYIPSLVDIDNNNDEKIQKEEFENFYIKQREKNNGIKYNSISPELAKIKQEAENIYNAIKGEEKTINKDIYSAFIDIIDETDGTKDKKYYQNNAQNLINKIKYQPETIIKDNKSLAQLIQKKLDLNKPYTQRRDFDVEQVHQGGLGNCFLLSTLTKHPEFIKDSGCLRWNADGSADVFLYDTEQKTIDNYKKIVAVGDKKCYHITKEELEKTEFELTKNNGEKQTVYIKSKQDFTLKALDIGFIKYCNYNYEKAVQSGGSLSTSIRMLFGNEKYKDMIYLCKPGKYTIDDLKDCIQVSIKSSSEKDKERNIGGEIIPTWHAMIFNKYNPQTGMISISNPWRNDLNSKEDDIEIPWDQFKNTFYIQLLTDKKSSSFIPL